MTHYNQIIELMRQEFKTNHHVVIDADDDYDEPIDSRANSSRVAISSNRVNIKKYSYQEVDSPEIFFVPAVWAATVRVYTVLTTTTTTTTTTTSTTTTFAVVRS